MVLKIRKYSSVETNFNSCPPRIQHLIKMRITPPLTREHMSSPVSFNIAVHTQKLLPYVSAPYYNFQNSH